MFERVRLNMRSLSLAAFAVSVIVGVTAGAPAMASDEADGYAIALEADRRDTGFKDHTVELEMVLRNAQGDESRRSLTVSTLEVVGDGVGDKSLILFSKPRDMDGTALLTHTRIDEPDDQWIFLPALKRVKRISAANKSGPFVGSEFAYEDLSAQELDKYTYKKLGEEPCGDLTCFVVEAYPKDERSGYTRQVRWIDTDEYRTVKIEYYDRKDALLKTLVSEDFRVYAGKYWRPHKMTMNNHQTGKSTELVFGEFRFMEGLDDDDFETDQLKRVR